MTKAEVLELCLKAILDDSSIETGEAVMYPGVTPNMDAVLFEAFFFSGIQATLEMARGLVISALNEDKSPLTVNARARARTSHIFELDTLDGPNGTIGSLWYGTIAPCSRDEVVARWPEKVDLTIFQIRLYQYAGPNGLLIGPEGRELEGVNAR